MNNNSTFQDAYATPAHRRIDLALFLCPVAFLAFMFYVRPQPARTHEPARASSTASAAAESVRLAQR